MAGALKEPKVLVVDDDPTSRMLILRVLSHLHVDAIEAGDGIEALVAIEEQDPDYLVLDLNMPNMDGFEVIEAVRKSPEHTYLPIVCMSSSSNVADIVRAKELGVVDYLLKPIRRHETHERLRVVFEEQADWRDHQANQSGSQGSNRRVLIVDPDANFREFAVPLLDTYRVTQTPSAGEGVKLCEEKQPAIILCAEDLPLLSEARFVNLIKRCAQEHNVVSPRVYLMSTAETVAAEKAALFSGVIRKSFVPDAFLKNFRAAVGEGVSRFAEFAETVRDGIDAEMMSATRQTMGVMTGQDARQVTGDEAVPGEVSSTIELRNDSQGFAMSVNLLCSREHTEEFAKMVLRREIAVGDGAEEVLGELANTVAARLIAALADKGFTLKIGVPDTQVGDFPAGSGDDWDATVDFATSEMQRFLLRVAAVEIPVTESFADFDLDDDDSPAAVTAADAETGGGDDSDLDDILF